MRAVADAAFSLDRPACGGDRASLHPILELSDANAQRFAAGCTGCGEAEPWCCASLPHALPSTASPVFLTQSLYDYSQLGDGGDGLGCTPQTTVAASSLPGPSGFYFSVCAPPPATLEGAPPV